MKNFTIALAIATTLLFTSGCNSAKREYEAQRANQIQEPGFDGIYEFHIDKTTIADLDKLPYKTKELTAANSIDPMLGVPGFDLIASNWDLLCKGVREIALEDFNNGAGICSYMVLTFYNNTLVAFRVSIRPDLVQQLEQKYPHKDPDDPLGSETRWHNGAIQIGFDIDEHDHGTVVLKGEDEDKCTEFRAQLSDVQKKDYKRKHGL